MKYRNDTASIQLGFSSMGAPELNLDSLASLAEEFGCAFVELRGLENTLDLAEYAKTHSAQLRDASKRIPVRIVATSLQLSDAGEEQIADFLRQAEVAELLGAPYVRVFGGAKWTEPMTDAILDNAVETVRVCRKELDGRQYSCRMLLETHSGFSSSERCLRLNERLDEPLEILWDSSHTWIHAGESPEQTWGKIGHLIAHIHYKDSLPALDERGRPVYTLPGHGGYPTHALLRLLEQKGFRGGFSLEWEKLWHPQLPEIRKALEAFVEVFSAN